MRPYFFLSFIWVGERKQLITVFAKPKPPKARSARSELASDTARLCDGGGPEDEEKGFEKSKPFCIEIILIISSRTEEHDVRL